MNQLITLALLALASIGAAANGDAAPSATSATSVIVTATATDGEVRKIDRELGKVTLKHGPITSLGMPGMTMVFKVADPDLLRDLKEGDRVRFFADRVNGAIAVTAIEPVR